MGRDAGTALPGSIYPEVCRRVLRWSRHLASHSDVRAGDLLHRPNMPRQGSGVLPGAQPRISRISDLPRNLANLSSG